MEQHQDTGVTGWVIFLTSFIASHVIQFFTFLGFLIPVFQFVAAFIAAFFAVIKMREWVIKQTYNKRKKGGI